MKHIYTIIGVLNNFPEVIASFRTFDEAENWIKEYTKSSFRYDDKSDLNIVRIDLPSESEGMIL